jgi:hypothetical protein
VEIIDRIVEMGWKFQLIAQVPLVDSTKTGWRASVNRRKSNNYMVHEWAEHENLSTALESVLFNLEQDRNRPGTDTWNKLHGADVTWSNKAKINIDVEISHYIMRRKKAGHVGFEGF